MPAVRGHAAAQGRSRWAEDLAVHPFRRAASAALEHLHDIGRIVRAVRFDDPVVGLQLLPTDLLVCLQHVVLLADEPIAPYIVDMHNFRVPEANAPRLEQVNVFLTEASF